MREDKPIRKRRLHRFLNTPWRTDQARAATLALITGAFFIIIAIISWVVPDNEDPAWWQWVLDLIYALAVLTILVFNASTCKVILKYRNLDYVRGFKITWLSLVKWIKTAPLNILAVFDVISFNDKEKLLLSPDTTLRNYKQYYREFARLHNSAQVQSDKINELASEASCATFPIITRLRSSTGIRKFASMEEFMDAAEGVIKKWGVVILETSQISEKTTHDTILDILQLLDAYPKEVWRIVAFGTDVVSRYDIARFMCKADCVLIYDECDAMVDVAEIPEPLISSSRLEKEKSHTGYAKGKYLWHGELPESFVKSAVAHEFLQARVAANAMFKLQNRKVLTRLEIVRLLKILSLGQTSIAEHDFPSEMLAEEHKSAALSLVTRELRYDSSQNEIVWKVSKLVFRKFRTVVSLLLTISLSLLFSDIPFRSSAAWRISCEAFFIVVMTDCFSGKTTLSPSIFVMEDSNSMA